MNNTTYIFSTIFFGGAILPLYWSYFLMKEDSSRLVNRSFIIMNLALSIWSFGFGMTNLQTNAVDALVWRRFSAIGWVSIISLILHFSILITSEEKGNGLGSKLYKRRFLLHLPMILFIYIFSFSNQFAATQYRLIQVGFGWTNQIVNNLWDYLYYCYYVIYLILSLLILYQWRNRLKEAIKIRQANLILTAFFFSSLASTFTDFIAPSLLPDFVPQLAPLFVLLPIWAMYDSIRHYGILELESGNIKEKFLTVKQETRIFKNLAVLLFLSGFLTFIFMFYSNKSSTSGQLWTSLLRGGDIVSLGVIVLLVQAIKNNFLREKLSFVFLVISIPIIILGTINSSSVTVWAYSILILIGTLLFDKRFLLISTTIMAIITQLIVWLLREDPYVYVSGFDFILRIGFLIIAFLLGSFVNKVYIARVRENREQIDFLELVSNITFDFLTFNEENSDEKIQKLLEKTGKFFDTDRIYLFTVNPSNETMTYTNEWCKTGVKSEIGSISEASLDDFSWWIEEFEKNDLIKIDRIEEMPVEAIQEREQLLRQKVKSLLAVPIVSNNRMYAFIGIDSVTEYRNWTLKEIRSLQILANILKNVLTPIQIDKRTEFMAYNDGLTKIPNRFLFINKVNQAINLSKSQGNIFVIIFIDLDNFKLVNDSLGHSGGDILLQQVAHKLEELIHTQDVLARFGGDEFLILVDNIEAMQSVQALVDQIINVFSRGFLIKDQIFPVTASLGISTYPKDGETAEILIGNADMAMYQAKTQGNNQFAFCTEEMKEKNLINQELTADLSLALERDEFVIHYQPQVSLKTNKIVGVEALIRWNHPEKGLIAPGIFIPLAEKNNLIDNIGEWVFKEAIIQTKKWQDMGLPHIKIAINLSASQIRNPEFSIHLKNMTLKVGLNPKYIDLEITETVAIEKSNLIFDNLNRIRETGASISIDDFGTEYSSLGRLKVLPVNQLKIDKQFVQEIENSDKDRAIITTVIALAKNLNLTVIAEGVETEEQLAFLREKKCDLVQGYFYYKPMPAMDIEKVLESS